MAETTNGNGTGAATLEVQELRDGRKQADPERYRPRCAPSETHALMGPNGSGKSTLSNVIMGRPGYQVTEGRVIFNGKTSPR